MKKRIVALVLATVMLALTLVSCGGGFNPVNENLDQYATFDLAGFKDALTKIEVEDGDFTTDETVRAKKVAESIYNAIADAYIKGVSDDDKLKEGALDANDVLYFCYYATYTDGDGIEYIFETSSMKESTITASSTSADHVIRLGSVDEDNEFMKLLAAAIGSASVDGKIYKTNATKNTSVKSGDKIVVSYNREYTVQGAEEGSTETFKETVLFETMDLVSGSSALVDLLLSSKADVKVGNDVKVTTGEGENAAAKTTFEVKEGDITYTYSNFGIEWIVETVGAPIAEFTYKPFDKETKVEPDGLHVNGTKIDLNGKDLTYHVYPVYYLDAPETDAAAIVKYVLGDKITVDSLEILGDETYKNGTATIADMIDVLNDIYDELFDENSEDPIIKNLYNLKKAFDDAEDEFDDADDPSTELEDKLDKAEKAYEDALDKAVDDQIAKILAATSTKTDAKVLSEAVVDEYEKDQYHTLKENYDKAIVESVGKEVYALFEKYVKINSYPEELVTEFRDHLYEEYEYKFYKDKYDSKTSNYKKYGGDFNKYMLEATGATKDYKGDIEAALIAEAKEAIDPIIRIYVIAKALEAEASDKMVSFVEKDIAQGAYNSFYQNDDDKTEEENKKLKDEADKTAKENADDALADAAEFIITDGVFEDYKNELGKSVYETWKKEYGERNIRTALQFNKLFYYLTNADYKIADDGDHVEILYKDNGSGERVLSFRNLTYSIKDKDADTSGSGSNG